MSKQFWAIIAVIIVVVVGIFFVSGRKSDSGSSSSTNSNAVSNNVEGKGSAGVKLVEYGDYQCPYCEAYYAPVKQAVANYNDQITFQYVNFPLTSLHQNAFAAARAAEAAGKQNKYWEMHDALYANNDPTGKTGWVASNTPSTYFDQFATQIGLNLNQFKSDFASSAVNATINADMAKGNDLGVDATPTFYLDNKKVDAKNLVDSSGQPSVQAFSTVIDNAIKAKK